VTSSKKTNISIVSKKIDSNKIKNKTPIEIIDSRISKELIIGLCGAIGSGINDLNTELKNFLASNGYAVENIKISDLIPKLKKDTSLLNLSGFDKYDKLQDAGNHLRRDFSETVLAEAAAEEIMIRRHNLIPEDRKSAEKVDSHKNTEPVAFIINQIKHPEEVKLLQKIYKHNFYLVGLLRLEKERKKCLESSDISKPEIDILLHKDKQDIEDYGQQVEKTIHLADYFIQNKNNDTILKKSVKRLVRLIHGYNERKWRYPIYRM